jgi:hypothetical protein
VRRIAESASCITRRPASRAARRPCGVIGTGGSDPLELLARPLGHHRLSVVPAESGPVYPVWRAHRERRRPQETGHPRRTTTLGPRRRVTPATAPAEGLPGPPIPPVRSGGNRARLCFASICSAASDSWIGLDDDGQLQRTAARVSRIAPRNRRRGVDWRHVRRFLLTKIPIRVVPPRLIDDRRKKPPKRPLRRD